MVPELQVSNFEKSLHFYEQLIGFSVMFQRTNPRFAYLDLNQAQLMIEEDHEGAWVVAALEAPRGRGINLQIDVPDVREVFARLQAANLEPYRPIVESWYETDEGQVGQLEFLVQDPDGYLIRLVSDLA